MQFFVKEMVELMSGMLISPIPTNLGLMDERKTQLEDNAWTLAFDSTFKSNEDG